MDPPDDLENAGGEEEEDLDLDDVGSMDSVEIKGMDVEQDLEDLEHLEQEGSSGGIAMDADSQEKQEEDEEKVLREMRENLEHLRSPGPLKASDKLAAVLTRGKSISVGPSQASRSSPRLRGHTGPIPINAMFEGMAEKRERLHDERSKSLSPWSSMPSALETRRSFFSSDEGSRQASTGGKSRQGMSVERAVQPYGARGVASDQDRTTADNVLAASGSSITMNARDGRPKASLAGIDELRTLHLAPAASNKSSILGIQRAKIVNKRMPSLTGVPFGQYRGVQSKEKEREDRHIRDANERLGGTEAPTEEALLEQVDFIIERHAQGKQSVWELDPKSNLGGSESVARSPPVVAVSAPAVPASPLAGAVSPPIQETAGPTPGGSDGAQKTAQPSGQSVSPQPVGDAEFVVHARDVLHQLQGCLWKFPNSMARAQKLDEASLSLQPQKLKLKPKFAQAMTDQELEKEADGLDLKHFSKARDSRVLLRSKFKKRAKSGTEPSACNFVCEGKVMLKVGTLLKKSATRTIFKWVKKPRSKQSQKVRHIRSRYATPDPTHTAPGIILDTYLLCRVGGVKVPKNLKCIKLHAMKIDKVVASDLLKFTSLRFIDLTDNRVPMDSVASAISMRKLCLQCNQISTLSILPGTFFCLEVLDLSFNNLGSSALADLAGLPALRRLNVDHNCVRDIPAIVGERGAFPFLQRLSLSGNKLESSSLSILSKISTLEKLVMSHNHITCVPPEVGRQSFIRLAFLNLSYNNIVGTEELAPLKHLVKLDKVLLFGNPLSKKATKDGQGRVLDIAKPILEDVQQAELYGQKWILEKPQPRKRPRQYAEKHTHCQISDDKIECTKVIPVEKLVNAMNRLSHKLDEQLSSGVTSRSMPFEEGMDEEVAELAFARTKKKLPVAKELEEIDEEPSSQKQRDVEAIQELASEPPLFSVEEHILDSNAAFATLKQTLSTPLIEKVFHVAHHQKMTTSGILRVQESRLKSQECTRAAEPTTPYIEELATRALEHSKGSVDRALTDMDFRLVTLESTISGLIENLKAAQSSRVQT